MGRLDGFRTFLWDKQERSFCGRTGRAWAEILTFFFFFYIILFSYFCGMLSFFFQTLDHRDPYLVGDKGYLEAPGIGVRPRLKTKYGNGITTLIYFSSDPKEDHTQECVDSLKEFLEKYKEANSNAKAKYAPYQHDCAADKTFKPHKHRSCKVDYDELAKANECSEANNFGYKDGKPCVVLRLNRIYEWVPKPYTGAHKSMPTELQNAARTHYTTAGASHLVWVYCVGEEDIDRMNLGNATTISYYPLQGFPVNHYPYMNQPLHLPPLVMVKFNGLTPNIAVTVQCKAFAKNIKFSQKTWEAGFHFELFYDKA